MKKTFTRIAMLACIGFFASCSKDVKAPEKTGNRSNAGTTNSTTQTATQTQQQGQGGCGNHSGAYNGGSASGH